MAQTAARAWMLWALMGALGASAQTADGGVPGGGADAAPASPGAEADLGALDLGALLDTPIESVSRKQERSSLAPAAAFVITADEIRAQGFRTVSDALRTVPGLFISDDSLYPVAGVRGVSLLGDLSTRLLVLVDGHPLNNSVGIGQSYLERDLPIDVLALDRIEVIKGPVGSVYGPVAYFGVVNLVTRTPDALTGDAQLAVDGEQNAIKGGELSLFGGGTIGPVRVSLNVGGYRSAGHDYAFPELEGLDRPTPPGGAVPGTDYRISQHAYLSARWGDFSASAGWGQRIKGLPTAPYSTILGDTRNSFWNAQGFASLTWQRQLTGVVGVFARLGYDEFHYLDLLAYPPPPDDLGLFKDVGIDRWLSAEARATITPFEGHRDTIGVEVQSHATHQLSKYADVPTLVEDPVNGFGVGNIDHDFRTLNAYLMVEQTFLDKVTLQGGLTFYAHELFGARLTPKLAAVWQVTDADVLKAIYSEGFRPPTMFEAFFEDGLDFIPNAALVPESARSIEGIYEHRFAAIASAGLSLYRSGYEGLITSTTVPAPGLDHPPDPNSPSDFRQQFQNLGKLVTRGVDAYFTVRHSRWITAYGGLAIQGGLFGEGPATQPNFAGVTANLAATTRALWEPLTLSAHAAIVGDRIKDPNSFLSGQSLTVPPYVMVNLSARLEAPWPAVKGLAAQLSIFNLFDATIRDPLVGDHAPLSEITQPGRQIRLTLEYRYSP